MKKAEKLQEDKGGNGAFLWFCKKDNNAEGGDDNFLFAHSYFNYSARGKAIVIFDEATW